LILITFSFVGIIFILTATPVFQGDFSLASLHVELLVIAHFRNPHPVLQIKQFILGLFSAAEKSIIIFKNISSQCVNAAES
jgi:hypothetical protein